MSRLSRVTECLMPFVKLDAGILASTIWFRSPERELFITALLLAQPRDFTEPVPTLFVDRLEETGFVVPPGWYGFVPASGPGIVHAAHIPNEAEGIEALRTLGEPEPDSRSQEFEGRRMVRINGGYLILNFMRYRDKDHTANERQRRLRDRKREAVTRDSHAVTRKITQSESRGQSTELIHPIPSATLTIADGIYALYPRKQGKKDALKAINLALKTCPKERLTERTQAFALAVQSWPQADKQFIPHPATWFNRGSYDDDPAQWVRKTSTLRASFA